MRSILLTILWGMLFCAQAHAQTSHNMTLLDHYDVDTLPLGSGYTFNDCWGYADCNGREYAILGSAHYVHFFDLADPADVQEVAAIPGGSNTLWREMRSFRQRAYSVCDNCQEGMMIFDLSQLPDTVVKTNQVSTFFKSAHTIFIDVEAGWLYAAGTNSTNNGLVILDLNADPDNPVQIGNPVLPGGYVHDMYVRNKIGYCSHGTNGYYVYDFSNPQAPVLLGTLTNYPQAGYNHSSWMTDDGQYMVMCDETHNKSVKMVAVSDPADMQVTDLFRSALLAPSDTASIAHNPLVRGNYAFISYYHDGIAVFDISDPYNVEKVAWYDTHVNTNYSGFQGCWGVYAFLPSGLVLGSDMHNGLYVFSLDLIELDPLPVPLNPSPDIALTGDPIFCEGQSVGLIADSAITSIEWYHDGELLENETSQLEASTPGFYTAILHDEYCITQADTVLVQVQIPPVMDILYQDSIACRGDSIPLSTTPGLDAWQWNLNGTPIPNATQGFWLAGESGLYSVTGSLGPCTATGDAVVIEMIDPAIPAIIFENDTLFSSPAVTYQWFFNGNPINGGIDPFLLPGLSGTYTVQTTDGFGCSAISEPLQVEILDSARERLPEGWKVYPNPVRGFLTIEIPAGARYQVTDLMGRVLMESTLKMSVNQVDLKSLAPGMYLLRLQSGGKTGVEKIWVR